MYAHHAGRVPGLAAPKADSSERTAAAASVDADLVSPAGLYPQKNPALMAQATQSREQNEHMNFATCTSGCKVFLTLRAQLALQGYCLTRSDSDDGPTLYYVSRWSLVRELRDLAAVGASLRQIGGAP